MSNSSGDTHTPHPTTRNHEYHRNFIDFHVVEALAPTPHNFKSWKMTGIARNFCYFGSIRASHRNSKIIEIRRISYIFHGPACGSPLHIQNPENLSNLIHIVVLEAPAPPFHHPKNWKCPECNTFSGVLEARAPTTPPQTMEIQLNLHSFGTVHEAGMPVSSTSSTRMSTKDIKQGPRICPFEVRDYANKIAEGEMSEAQMAQATNRKA